MKLTDIRSVTINTLTVTFTDAANFEVRAFVEVFAATKEVLSIKGDNTVIAPNEMKDIVAFLKSMGFNA